MNYIENQNKKQDLINQSINQSINFISRRMTEIQITFALEIFKIEHKLNKQTICEKEENE